MSEREPIRAREDERRRLRSSDPAGRRAGTKEDIGWESNFSERFRTLFESAHEALMVLRDVAIVECNRGTVELFGCDSRSDLLGRCPWELSPVCQPDGQNSADKARQLVTDALEREPQFFDWVHLKKDGSPFEAAVSLSAFVDNDQRMLLAIVKDVTHQRRALRELAFREATLNSIFTASPVAMGVAVNRVVQQANIRMCEMLLYSAEEIIGREGRFLYPTEEDYTYVGTEKYRLMAKQGWGTVETRWLRKDGQIIDVLLSSAPIVPGNPAAGITFTAIDITQRKRNELLLRSLVETTSWATGRQFFRSLVEDTTRGLGFRFAHIGIVTGADRNMIRTLAFWNGERIDKNFEYNLSGTPCATVIQKAACFHYNSVAEQFPEDLWLKENGVESYLGMPLMGRSGDVLGILAVMDTKSVDQTKAEQAQSLLAVFASRAISEFERMHADDQLRQANEELRSEQQALKEKNIALSEILSHMERDREKYRHELCESVSHLFEPVMEKLRDSGGGRLTEKEVALLDNAMKSIIGKDLDQFRDNFARLSPREMEICDMIREGMSSKDIAEALSVSLTTVHKHREMIRKKLRIQNRDINLSAYLRYKS